MLSPPPEEEGGGGDVLVSCGDVRLFENDEELDSLCGGCWLLVCRCLAWLLLSVYIVVVVGACGVLWWPWWHYQHEYPCLLFVFLDC